MKTEGLNKIHQVDVALIQLEKACELFFRKDYISSLTLAGAAEEILGNISEKESKKFLNRKKNDRGISAFNMQAELFENLMGQDYSTFKQKRNQTRNELKHLKDNYTVDISELELKVKQIIGDAVTNYKLISGELPKLSQIKRFCKKVGIS